MRAIIVILGILLIGSVMIAGFVADSKRFEAALAADFEFRKACHERGGEVSGIRGKSGHIIKWCIRRGEVLDRQERGENK